MLYKESNLCGGCIYGVGKRCDPLSNQSSEDEMEKQSALYIAINKRKYRIENERKKVTN
jgi:hypothetical protein